MGQSKKHHYVPQSTLRRFSRPDAPGQLYVYDKEQGTSRPSSVLDAGMENNFNVVFIDGERINFEDEFSAVDGAIAAVHKKLETHRNLSVLDDADRAVLFDGAATQLLRTKMLRSTLEHTVAELIGEFAKMGLTSPEFAKVDDQSVRQIARESFHERDGEREALASKELLLLQPEKGNFFWTSDNPIARYQPLPFGDSGLSSDGIEIYWPITPELAVAFLGRSFRQTVDNAYSLNLDLPQREAIRAMHGAFATGRPCDDLGRGSTADFLNQLQIRQSSRFIYSRDNDFALLERVVAADPSLRSVKSMAFVGKMGEGLPQRPRMPPGLQIVVFGRERQHMHPIKKHVTVDWGLDIVIDDDIRRWILSDQPWREVRIYNDGREIRNLKSIRAFESPSDDGPILSVRHDFVVPATGGK